MEADWAAEIGPDLPEIDVPWEGFIDLRSNPDKLRAVIEAAHSQAIASAMTALNSETSPVFTSKADLWNIDREEIDPDEFGARPEDAQCGRASYLDILERSVDNLTSFEFHQKNAKQLVKDLQTLPIGNGRVDLVIRPATVDGQQGYGITLYAAGCGADSNAAEANWETVLAAAVMATIGLNRLM